MHEERVVPPDVLPALLADLRAELGPEAVLGERRDLEVYGYDATLEHSLPDAVVLPRSTEEVAAVMRVCQRAGVPVIPRGSGTSLSGGPVPVVGGVVVSLARMNRILRLDLENLQAVVQPGVINAHLDAAAQAHGLMYAPDPASHTACTLGGNVAENAGGPHCLRYGVTANHVLGVTLVTPQAEVLQLGGQAFLHGGLDLRGLIIGSEGTLGIVTEIICRLLPQPPARLTMLACFASTQEAAQAVSDLIAAGLLPASLEMIDRHVIEAVEMHRQLGYPRDAEAVLVMELDGLPAALEAHMEEAQTICQRRGVLRFEGASSPEARAKLWRGREGATAALALLAPARLSTDVTVPRSRLPEALAEVARIAERFGLLIANVFHAGDGNLHPQVLFDPRDPEQRARAQAADDAITEMALRLGGVVTGEHGIGSQKRKWMTRAYRAAELAVMWAVKRAFDPLGLCNPGKLLPDPAALAAPPLPAPSGTIAAPRYEPGSEAELAELLAACRAAGLRAHAPEHSLLTTPGTVQLALSKLDQLLDYAPADLTVTVQAGLRLGQLQRLLAEQGQHLGAWDALPAALPVGRLVATAPPAPSMVRYGLTRDFVLGLRVARPGEVLRLGSACVKNASGYALERLFVGSFCAFGIITAVTLRTHPLPKCQITLAWLAEDLGTAQAYARLLARSPATLAAARFLPQRPASEASCLGPWRIYVTLAGHQGEVEESARLLDQLIQASGLGGQLMRAEPSPLPPPPCGPTVRFYALPPAQSLSPPPSLLPRLLEVWPLLGVVAVSAESTGPDELAPGALPNNVDELFALTPPAALPLVRRLKEALDPEGIFPPWPDNQS
jgi:D-lactate dehydrogenase (cytochrome)